MTYPDGELLTYEYNPGGLLRAINGVKDGQQYAYVLTINYDKFERRTSIRYGNNVVTEYTYNDLSFNLSNLKVVNTYAGNRCLMDNAYTYDAVDNVTKVTNTAPIPSTGIGGNITHNYSYDGLYRLKTAGGTYTGNAGKAAIYNLVMAYDNLHNIIGKKLDMGQSNMQFTGDLETGYDLTYGYNPTNDQQLTQVADTGYRWLGNPTPLTGSVHRYAYDANGNLTQVLTTRMEPMPQGQGQGQGQADSREVMLNNRRLLWDEENRLTAVSDNGYVSTYLYDASGERTVKLSGDGEGMTVNGRLSGGRTGTEGFTAYVNPYVVIANGSRLSKHIYAGSQRIVSKLCASGSSPSNPLTIAKAAEGVVNYTAKYTALKASVAARYDSLGLPFLGTDHAGSGFWTSTPTTRETDQYFYHPDHLGSSSLITTLGGSLAQHLEYLPFGEVFVDERATPTTRSTPYKFNAKELDEETGLYYYSARYMDPRLSLWLSVDPLAEKYPGVGSYVYCYNNPVKFVDPDGRAIRIPSGASGRESALSLLHGTLTHSESKYVRANTNGFIDPILIQKGKVVMGDNVSGNYSDLLEIVNSDKIVDFSAPKNKTANDANGKQVPADMMAFPFADPVADEYNNYIPELQGGLGITLAPSTHQWTEQDKKQKMLLPSEQQYYSTNGNYQVQVNGRGLGNKNTFNQLVRTTAHEMYGHLLMMFRGKNALHTSRRDGIGANVELENQIQKRVNEAEQNFNNKW